MIGTLKVEANVWFHLDQAYCVVEEIVEAEFVFEQIRAINLGFA